MILLVKFRDDSLSIIIAMAIITVYDVTQNEKHTCSAPDYYTLKTTEWSAPQTDIGGHAEYTFESSSA